MDGSETNTAHLGGTAQQLWDGEQEFQEIFGVMPLGVICRDAERGVTTANPAALRILRMSLDELQRLHVSWPPGRRLIRRDGTEFPADEFPLWAAVRTGQKIHDVVLGLLDQRSTLPTWIRIHAAPQSSQVASQPRRAYATLEDVTERVQAQEALRESEEHYRSLYENALVGMFRARISDGKLLRANAAAAQLLGYPSGQAMVDAAVAVSGFCLPERREQLVRQLAEHGEVSGFEVHFALPSGQELDVILSVQSYPSEGYLEGIVVDITDRKRTEAALRESEEKFRALADQALTAIVIMQGHRIVYANQATADLSGYPREEILAWGPEEYLRGIHPDDRELVATQARKRALGDPSALAQYEYRLLTKHGAVKRVLQHVKTTILGGKVSSVSSGVDITALRSAEQERADLQAQILHSQKLESLGVLAGGIAHDFNNLLCVMLGSAELAQHRIGRDHPAFDNLELVRESAERAAALCQQMLAYSGKGRFVIEPQDVSRVVRSVAHLLQVSISKKAHLRYELAPELPAVEADATQLRQVLLNLVVNASEALGDDGGQIDVVTRVLDCDRGCLRGSYLADDLAPGRYVCLEVADSGSGMDEQTRARVFDPFFSTKFAGRGLGLAAVLGIVRGHRGAIEVQSEPGKGSLFRVLLPESEKQCVAAPQAGVEPESWQGRGLALLVDDEPGVRAVGREMLEKCGFEVVTAADGGQGVLAYRERAHEFVLVVLDLTMPDLNGEEAFREIRKIRPEARVILTSGYDESETSQRFGGHGPAAFLQKPFHMATLREKVRAVLEA
jgi:two-component system cell cycle sensor histidine kinase/response regulator CckA